MPSPSVFEQAAQTDVAQRFWQAARCLDRWSLTQAWQQGMCPRARNEEGVGILVVLMEAGLRCGDVGRAVGAVQEALDLGATFGPEAPTQALVHAWVLNMGARGQACAAAYTGWPLAGVGPTEPSRQRMG